MKTEGIIKLGTTLGIPFVKESNYEYMLKEDIVVFSGINCQRFLIEGRKMSDDEILEAMGDALKHIGRRQLKLELNTLLNITSDN